ncbi:MAG TPA: C4-dicarboxylate TRAP transporter substrate-binding protein [Alphaproteobacteria bacterium]|nr:C4-dicarboxylate TRAP transporter substrate-binding protein [Alphaproteobacteria bacterium]
MFHNKGLKALCLALPMALAIGGAAQAGSQLKGSNWLSPKHPTSKGYESFANTVKTESNGALSFRVFTGGALLGAKATLDGVKDGVADMGHIVYTYTPASFPHGVFLADLAMVGPNQMAASAALTELQALQCPGCQDDFKNTNTVFLGSYSTPSYVLIGNGEFNSPEGLKGKKMRSGGNLWDRWAHAVGGVPVNVPSSDIREGLSRGQLDIAIYAVGGLKTHSLADVADHVVMLPVGAFRADSVFAFNRGTWKGLSKENREILLKAAATAIVDTNIAYAKGDEDGLALAKKKGIKVEQPSPALMKVHEEFIENDLKQTLPKAKKEYGIADPQAVVDTYKQLYAKYDKLVAAADGDHDKLVQMFWDNIFSKLDPASYGMN